MCEKKTKKTITACATRSEVEGIVKTWLKYAQDRLGPRKDRKNYNKRKPEDTNGNDRKSRKSDDSDSQ